MIKYNLIYACIGLLGLLSIMSWLIHPGDMTPKEIRLALRMVGHELLLDYGDSASLVLPIKKQGEYTYEINFQRPLGINPDSLISYLNNNISGAGLPLEYFAEVQNHRNGETVYEYQMSMNEAEILIPCQGRGLPASHYSVFVTLTGRQLFNLSSKDRLFYFVMALLISCAAAAAIVAKQNQASNPLKIGGFDFIKEERVLRFGQQDINLTGKECELLELLSKKPNKFISRDELSKEIWENKGVIVGRSLDNYVSKLRKKLALDERIKITNLHGRGYKLVVK